MRPRAGDHDAILKDYLAGYSANELAAKYNCAGNIGVRLAKARGVSRSPEVVKRVNKLRGKHSRESQDKLPQRIKQLRKYIRLGEYAKRHGLPAAAAKYGYSEGQARYIAKRNGWIPTVNRFDQQAILKDYLDGMKIRDIAAKHGCNLVYPSQLAKVAGKLRQNRGKRNAHLEFPVRTSNHAARAP